MNKPSDQKVREAIQAIFSIPTVGTGLSNFDIQFKSRVLLHHWSLSRVERLSFRSDELPSLIFKAVLPPLHNELDIYLDLFQDNRRWTPTLYGSARLNEEVWLFLEDLGTRTFKSEVTYENLQRVTNTLAGMHVAFGREVANGQLQSRSHLAVRDYPAYIAGARQALVLTRALVSRNLFPSVTNNHLAKLEAVVSVYDRVAIGLLGAPQTLVHGDFNPQNIIFDPIPGGERVFIIDWANAYIGAGLIDLVDLATFASTHFGPDTMPRLLQTYRAAYRVASGEPIATAPLDELFVCGQIEKKIGLIRWYAQCSLKWIPTGVQAYDHMVSGLIEEVYELSTILV
ncbi:MAG: phosphotransferase [Chloroflexi bacterium]|nr:phosphotransferase [Chloroflexota bacterium]